MSWTRTILAYGAHHRAALVGLGLLAAAEVGVGLLLPWPMKLIVDNVLAGVPLPGTMTLLEHLPGGNTAPGQLVWLALLTAVLFAFLRLVGGIRTVAQTDLGERLTREVAGDVFDRLQRMSPGAARRRSTGDAMTRVLTDSTCARALLIDVVVPAGIALLTLAGMFVVLWSLEPRLALLSIAIAVPIAFMIIIFGSRLTARSLEMSEREAVLMAHSERVLTALPEVQAFTREPVEHDQFSSLAESTISAGIRHTVAETRFTVATGVVTAAGTAAVMAFGGFAVLGSDFTVGSLLVFLAYLAALYAPLWTLTSLTASYGTAAARGRRVVEVLEVVDEVQDPARPVDLPRATARGRVVFDGVTVEYEPGRPVLVDLDLSAVSGQTVALMGSTGAGKTTLVSLIPRFLDPVRGRVLVDGIDVRRLRLAELRRQVALVRQDPLLLPVSIADNIAYGRPGAGRDEIVHAAIAANADGFIRDLPQGYDTVLGERGATLSGGQRQRIAIARALLKDAPILILDEPTSALDADTEAQLMEALQRLMRGRTTFLITHRLSAVRAADHIVVIENGHIVEAGSHDELLAADGRYRHYHTLQTPTPAGTP